MGTLNQSYFAYYEDTDLSFRIHKAGYKIKVIPQSIVWHKVSQSTTQKEKGKTGVIQSYLLARNGLLFGTLNLSGLNKVIYLTSQYLIKFPLYLLFKVDSLKSAIAYIEGVVDGTQYLQNNRLHSQARIKYVK